MTTTLAIFGLPGHWEIIVILVVGLLLFGKRLPEVGRSLGRSIVEFKKGIKGIEDEINQEVDSPEKRKLDPPANPTVPTGTQQSAEQTPPSSGGQQHPA